MNPEKRILKYTHGRQHILFQKTVTKCLLGWFFFIETDTKWRGYSTLRSFLKQQCLVLYWTELNYFSGAALHIDSEGGYLHSIYASWIYQSLPLIALNIFALKCLLFLADFNVVKRKWEQFSLLCFSHFKDVEPNWLSWLII